MDYCTEAEVRQIAKQVFDTKFNDYERMVIQPRHMETQNLMNRIAGGVTTLKVLAGIIALMIPTAALFTTIYFHYHP